MQDDDITLNNACADLVSLKKWEIFPLRLLSNKRAGEWIGVRDFCQQIGVGAGELPTGLFAAWLPDPNAQDAYVVIVFYDDESLWSMAAHYNRARLVGGATSNPALQQTGNALPTTSGSASQKAAPAAEL